MDQQFLAGDQFKAISLKKDAIDTNVDIVGLIEINQFTKAKLVVVELLDELDELEKLLNQNKQNNSFDLCIDHQNRSFVMLVPK